MLRESIGILSIGTLLAGPLLAGPASAHSTNALTPLAPWSANVTQGAGGQPSAVDRIVLLARNGDATSEALIQTLAQQRSALLFNVLVRGTVLENRDGVHSQRNYLSAEEKTALRASLYARPREERDAFFEERLRTGPTLVERATLLKFMGTHGNVNDVATLLAWAQTEPDDVRIPRAIQAAFSASLGELYRRDQDALKRSLWAYRRAHLSLLPGVVASINSSAEPARLDALTAILGEHPAFDTHILSEIDALVKRARFAPSGRSQERVRRYLSSQDESLRDQAILVVRTLGDGSAVEILVKMLKNADQALAKQITETLYALTGESLGPYRDVWDNWLEQASTKWQAKGARFLSVAANGSPNKASSAIKELATMRMYRDEVIDPLARALDRDETEIVALAAASIGHLGSLRATPHLLHALEDPRIEVRRAAYTALRRLTGENHGAQPTAWRAAGWGVVTD